MKGPQAVSGTSFGIRRMANKIKRNHASRVVVDFVHGETSLQQSGYGEMRL
jgi:hypothetical protein